MSKKFLEKQKNGIRIESAEWIPDKGKPDKPDYWNRCKIRLEDKSVYTVKKNILDNHQWLWKTMLDRIFETSPIRQIAKVEIETDA